MLDHLVVKCFANFESRIDLEIGSKEDQDCCSNVKSEDHCDIEQ